MQVTLEEQMICGALQTLNEEAMEDVLQSEPPSHPGEPLRTISEHPPATLPSLSVSRDLTPATSEDDTDDEQPAPAPKRDHIVNFTDDVFL